MRKVLLSDRSLQLLFGPLDENIRFLENLFGVTIQTRDSSLAIDGEEDDVTALEKILVDFSTLVDRGHSITNGDLKSAFKQIAEDAALSLHDFFPKMQLLTTGKRQVTPKSLNQRRYIEAIRSKDIVFGIGPGGTGKTFLAVAMAITYLLEKSVSRIVLTRPAVEAGERLGFLPGDIEEKINPYLRPLYDSLHILLDSEKIQRFMEDGTIEIAPLAFMRGRTLSDAFIILDEAQNTTSEQMKMFLTRIGLRSKAVITGDVTQIDLPLGRGSGLVEARTILGDVEGLAFCYFNERDVVRHHLVRLIIKAYQQHAEKEILSEGNGNNGKRSKD
ncbi:MAG: Phosphate starvation-inducible protein PhoH, predicted ATPase [Acidobacteria bacterium]|nr:Phosphate starvation-inducible protein PhoH, predicted ATPase [Acidobacteriota bacterium]